MEKNFTLMKTLTAAFLDLLFPCRKNSHALTAIIDQPSTMDAPQLTNDDQKLKSKEE